MNWFVSNPFAEWYADLYDQYTRIIKKLVPHSLVIVGQEISCGRTLYIIQDRLKKCELRKFAHELYCHPTSLEKFSREDLVNIVSTAVQEQTLSDLFKMNYTNKNIDRVIVGEPS